MLFNDFDSADLASDVDAHARTLQRLVAQSTVWEAKVRSPRCAQRSLCALLLAHREPAAGSERCARVPRQRRRAQHSLLARQQRRFRASPRAAARQLSPLARLPRARAWRRSRNFRRDVSLQLPHIRFN